MLPPPRDRLAVRCGAVRCDAVRCGAVRSEAVKRSRRSKRRALARAGSPEVAGSASQASFCLNSFSSFGEGRSWRFRSWRGTQLARDAAGVFPRVFPTRPSPGRSWRRRRSVSLLRGRASAHRPQCRRADERRRGDGAGAGAAHRREVERRGAGGGVRRCGGTRAVRRAAFPPPTPPPPLPPPSPRPLPPTPPHAHPARC